MVDRFFTPEGVEMKISLKTKRVLAKLLEGCSVDMDDYTPKEQNEVGLCYWYGHIVPLNYEEAGYVKPLNIMMQERSSFWRRIIIMEGGSCKIIKMRHFGLRKAMAMPSRAKTPSR